jgi:hypothetical protein
VLLFLNENNKIISFLNRLINFWGVNPSCKRVSVLPDDVYLTATLIGYFFPHMDINATNEVYVQHKLGNTETRAGFSFRVVFFYKLSAPASVFLLACVLWVTETYTENVKELITGYHVEW